MSSREQDLPLAERACIPATQIIDVLKSLSSTLIFNTANSEERLALASRLRHWVVEDGTYLIREGDGDRNRSAIFMIGERRGGGSVGQAKSRARKLSRGAHWSAGRLGRVHACRPRGA